MRRILLGAWDDSVVYTRVDDADFDWLNSFRWHRIRSGKGYVARRDPAQRKRYVYMHRVILALALGDPRMGEHINRDSLDNRRSNLRIAERGQRDNLQNRGAQRNSFSGRRGVVWDKQRQKWCAEAGIDGRKVHLGRFAEIEEADAVVKAWRAAHMPFSEDARAAA